VGNPEELSLEQVREMIPVLLMYFKGCVAITQVSFGRQMVSG
jgi:hypothetical protein